LDFWASEDARSPYYRALGLAYIEHARNLLGGGKSLDEEKDPRLAQYRDRKDELTAGENVTARLLLGGEPADPKVPVYLTDEDRLELRYGVRADDKKVPPGYPVVWRELKVGKVFLKPAQGEEGVRLPLQGVGPDLKKTTVPCALDRLPPPRAGAPQKEKAEF